MTVSLRSSLATMAVVLSFSVGAADADVLNWQTNEVIPGTEGITPGPGVDFSSLDINGLDLRYADFSGYDLTGTDFRIANLSHALFDEANLTDASLDHTILTETDFSDAIIRGASFRRSGSNLTFEQLSSTASYKMKDLRGIVINVDMRNWDLSGQDLSDADFFGAFLGDADLTGAIINGTSFPWRSFSVHENDTLMFSEDQLYSTASYQEKNMKRVQIVNSDLTSWDFSGQDLRCTDFFGSDFRDADLANTDLRNANFDNGKGLDEANFDGNTTYNEWTGFPRNFDPIAAGLTFTSSLGDFDLNEVLDTADIDILSEIFDEDRERGWREISQCSSGLSLLQFFLLDGEPGSEGDHRFWVKEVKNTYFGDANLDGEFNSADLVQVFQAGEYEDDLRNNSGWADGDWTADQEFTSSDLVAAFQDGGFEQGPLATANAVPEPNVLLMLTAGLIGMAPRRKRVLA